MNLIFAAICTTLCLSSGLANDIGQLNGTVDIGTMKPPAQLTDEDIYASKNLMGLLEYVRRLMPVGINKLIPPMEPYVKETLVPIIFDNPNSKLKGKLEVSNLVVSGAQGFVMNNLEVHHNQQRVDFDVTVPQVIADLDYVALNFKYGPFVFNTSGHIQLTLEDLHLKGAFGTVVADIVPIYGVSGLYVENGAYVKINLDISIVPSELIEEIKDELLKSIGKTAISQMDDILRGFTVDQVEKFLFGS